MTENVVIEMEKSGNIFLFFIKKNSFDSDRETLERNSSVGMGEEENDLNIRIEWK